jgi:hypothetical protein
MLTFPVLNHIHRLQGWNDVRLSDACHLAVISDNKYIKY